MLRYLHSLSSFFFYALGSSFFVAYILVRNGMWGSWSALWLQVADLPFALCAILYGGLSLFLSLHAPEHPSKALPWLIGVPLVAFFALLVTLNFWGVWPFAG